MHNQKFKNMENSVNSLVEQTKRQQVKGFTDTGTSINSLNSVQNLLKITFGLVPVLAGLDKFTNLLVDWTSYLSPNLVQLIPFSPHTFMILVGLVEMFAGLLVLFKTKIGAPVVSAWLVLIAITLIINGKYDVAVRDLVMAIAAFSLLRLTLILQKDKG
jgi:uncharacterized membrane protein YphA (DoxX/SURF4 family)